MSITSILILTKSQCRARHSPVFPEVKSEKAGLQLLSRFIAMNNTKSFLILKEPSSFVLLDADGSGRGITQVEYHPIIIGKQQRSYSRL